MAGNTARRRDRRKGMDQPRARRRNWFREVSEKFHKRAMDITSFCSGDVPASGSRSSRYCTSVSCFS